MSKTDEKPTAPLGVIDEERKRVVTESIDSLPLISEVLELLSKKLPKNLFYHAKSHTDDVLREVVLFALVDGLSSEEMRLLAIAAAYHDVGFIHSPVDNERIGAHMARQAMREAGTFTEKEIETVVRMIMDTRLVETSSGLRQVASIDLSRYLLDADLSNFGREDFFDKLELQRKELGYDRELFLRKTFELINNHRWLTNAGMELRQQQKSLNIQSLKSMLQQSDNSEFRLSSLELGIERLIFLAKLPLLLNSSLKTRKVVELAIEHLRSRIGADAATVFILEEGARELTFWAMKGGEGMRLEGMRMPAGKGIVGWVIDHQESVMSNDVSKDQRFFDKIDKEGKGFTTKNLICVPLTVRGSVPIGAIQVLNKPGEVGFSEDDLLFVEQFSHQLAMAIDNSKLYEKLAEKNRALEIMDRRKNEMIQVIAHEFRTPLNVIQTSADLITFKSIRNEQTMQEIYDTLIRGVDRLARLISQIRNVSLLQRTEVELEKEAIPVNELVERAVSQFKEGAQSRKIAISSIVSEEAGNVLGDFALILIVLNNLISNAIRFTQDMGEISISATKGGGLVRFSVKDSGIGIEASDLDLIFEKFYEVGDSFQHSSGELEFMSGGLGLGLSTVRSILLAHGSKIEVKSTPGKGSEFIFNLACCDSASEKTI